MFLRSCFAVIVIILGCQDSITSFPQNLIKSQSELRDIISSPNEANSIATRNKVAKELKTMGNVIDKLPDYVETIFTNLKLNPNMKVIRKSINTLNNYFNSSSSVHHKEVLIIIEELENSIVEILKHLISGDSTKEAYLDVLRNYSIGRLLNSLYDMRDLVKGIVLPETTKGTQQINIKEYLRQLLKEVNEDNVPTEMENIMVKNANKSNRQVADLLYNYLSAKYDTKDWLVVTYDAFGGFKDHQFWHFDHLALRHGGKNAAAISFERDLYQVQRSYLDSLESKFHNNCIKTSIMSSQRDEMCQRNRQPSAEKLGQQLREKGVVKTDSHLAVIHGGIEVTAHSKIKYYLGPSKTSSSSYTFLVVPAQSTRHM